jgi:hypothetical protein
MEAICSSETSVETQRTAWSYIPEDGTLQMSYDFSKNVSRKMYGWKLRKCRNINVLLTQYILWESCKSWVLKRTVQLASEVNWNGAELQRNS